MRQYSYRLRLYPNTSQEEFLAKQFGCCRFVYNYKHTVASSQYCTGRECPSTLVD